MSSSEAAGPAVTKHHVLALVVERNVIVQRLERFFLEKAGYDVEFASDGVSALARARELHPAILVTEILVPKMDGLTLCRLLKSQPETQEILVLVFSHLEAEDRALDAGADAFLRKPMSEEPVVEILGRLVARHQEILREKK
jgi:CheY-like chemotaxis protein